MQSLTLSFDQVLRQRLNLYLQAKIMALMSKALIENLIFGHSWVIFWWQGLSFLLLLCFCFTFVAWRPVGGTFESESLGPKKVPENKNTENF